MSYSFIDATARAAFNAAAHQTAQIAAISAVLPGSAAVRYYTGGGVLLGTATHAGLSAMDTGTTPYSVTLGALSAWSPLQLGLAAYCVLSVPGGADILRADVTMDAPVNIDARRNLALNAGAAGLRLYASAGLPVNGLPVWAQGLAIGQWAQVPVVTTLSALDPGANPAYNALFPASAPWRGNSGHASVVGAYSGACYDTATDTLWLPPRGGHQDYAGNEPYRCALRADVPAWEMLRPPSGSIPLGAITYLDGLEATGLYSDGRPRPGHTYAHEVYIPGIGPVTTQITNAYPASGTGKRLMQVLNESTGESTTLVDWSGATQAGGNIGGACWDTVRARVFSVASETARPYTIPVAGPATARGTSNNIFSGPATLQYCQGIDVIVAMSNPAVGYRAAAGFTVFDPATGDDFQPAITGSFASGFVLAAGAGMAWDDVGQRLILWNNTTNRAQLSTLTPPASPTTQPWVAGSIAIAGANAVTPSAPTPVGTWGRFALSPFLGGCFLLNATNQPIYFVRTH